MESLSAFRELLVLLQASLVLCLPAASSGLAGDNVSSGRKMFSPKYFCPLTGLECSASGKRLPASLIRALTSASHPQHVWLWGDSSHAVQRVQLTFFAPCSLQPPGFLLLGSTRELLRYNRLMSRLLYEVNAD